MTKYQQINDYVHAEFLKARDRGLLVRGDRLRNWALEKARELNASETFLASKTWLWKFKNTYKITSRHITDRSTAAQERQQDAIEDSIDQFLEKFEKEEQFFRRDRIWNVDQTGFNYELVPTRTLKTKGTRDVRVSIRQANLATHSYTAQPVISRSGKVIGKLLLCLQETNGRFGPIIERQVRELEREYKNIRVIASRSGKMDIERMVNWLEEVFYPAVRDTLSPIDTDTDVSDVHSLERMSISSSQFGQHNQTLVSGSSSQGSESQGPVHLAAERRGLERRYKRPHTLLLMDAWGGHKNDQVTRFLRDIGVEILDIPKLTTGDIQPLDVGFMRQYKLFFKTIATEATHQSMGCNVTSRAGVINVHSLIWNQFSSERYTDMIRYAWRNTDPSFNIYSLTGGPKVRTVKDIQFSNLNGTMCSHHDEGPRGRVPCRNRAFMRCSFDGKPLCLKHFLSRSHFHENDGPRAGPSHESHDSTTPSSSSPYYHDELA